MILYSANQFWLGMETKKQHKGDSLCVKAQNSGVDPILDGSLISSGLHPTGCSCSSGEISFVNDSLA